MLIAGVVDVDAGQSIRELKNPGVTSRFYNEFTLFPANVEALLV